MWFILMWFIPAVKGEKTTERGSDYRGLCFSFPDAFDVRKPWTKGLH